MKFCKYRTFEELRNNNTVVYNYVTLEDIKTFHGEEFKNQFYLFIKEKLKPSVFGKYEGYFYIDYQFYGYRTKMWLESE